MKKVKDYLLSFFFPKVCPLCGKIILATEELCGECKKEQWMIQEPRCQKCGKALRNEGNIYCKDCKIRRHLFDQGRDVFLYRGKVRDSIHRFKYKNVRQFAEYYGEVACREFAGTLKEWKVECIIPVPMYHKKEIKRGYNQAEVFGKVLSKKTGIPIRKNLLIRKKDTKPQKELTGQKRYENLKGAFAVSAEGVKGLQAVLLVDDIYTTGSTLDACAGLLKKAGVKRVYFLNIAAGMDEEE
ncbi:MAG: ComF family protein [Eubacterium sp.]|nr:ComF family protein [Eubacterium sp.]